MDLGYAGEVLATIVPTIGLLAIFWLVMRSIMNADRNERQAEAEFLAAERQKAKADRQQSSGDASID